MSDTTMEAVADFVRKGGRIEKLPETIPVTGPEVLDYLASCGVKARFGPTNSALYVYESKQLSLRNLVDLANRYRRDQRLAPFAARV